MNNQVQKNQQSMAQFLNGTNTAKFLESTLRESKSEFVSNLIALTDADKNLQACDPADIMKCALNATSLKLPLNKNLGYAYVIPYGGKVNFQMGYKGFIQLAVRSGQYKTINTCEVREGEIKRNKFTGEIEFLGEKPDKPIIGYLAYIRLNNGFEQSLYMTTEEIEAHAKEYSQSFAKWGTGLWKDKFDLMAKKTVLKLLLNRYGVLSVEMQNAITKDQTDADGDYSDNPSSFRDVVDTEVIQQDEPQGHVDTDTGEVINLDEL